jgi:hypothetical protein
MFFSWYAADYTTDPDFAEVDPETRANPSRGTWADPHYLEQQRSRLPAHKYRRLHLNLPGLPEGSAFQVEPITDAIARGVSRRAPAPGVAYRAFVDMSGGSSDDAVLAIAHRDAEGRVVIDAVVTQGPPPPFDPRRAVERFAGVLAEYGLARVTGDRYAGQTFVADFQRHGITYEVAALTRSQLYEGLEPRLNAREVVLPDVALLEQQLLGLVWRGGKIDHAGGEHDDLANAVAGVVATLVSGRAPGDHGITIGDVGNFAEPPTPSVGNWRHHDYEPNRHELEIPPCGGCGRRHPGRACVLQEAALGADATARELERIFGEGPRCARCGARHRGAACATPE